MKTSAIEQIIGRIIAVLAVFLTIRIITWIIILVYLALASSCTAQQKLLRENNHKTAPFR